MTATKTGKKHWTSYTVPGIWSLPEHQKISHAIRVGNTIHISGQTARGLNGEAEGGSDVEAQGLAIWRHIETILTSVGASMDDIVKVFQFVVGKENFAGMSRARKAALGDAKLRAITSVVVAGLARPDLLLEVDVIAVVPD
jgi:enamine deaminase RidA (YjgF/YER057c/UK114 family)